MSRDPIIRVRNPIGEPNKSALCAELLLSLCLPPPSPAPRARVIYSLPEGKGENYHCCSLTWFLVALRSCLWLSIADGIPGCSSPGITRLFCCACIAWS